MLSEVCGGHKSRPLTYHLHSIGYSFCCQVIVTDVKLFNFKIMEQGLSGVKNCRSGMQLIFQLDPQKASMFRVDS